MVFHALDGFGGGLLLGGEQGGVDVLVGEDAGHRGVLFLCFLVSHGRNADRYLLEPGRLEIDSCVSDFVLRGVERS